MKRFIHAPPVREGYIFRQIFIHTCPLWKHVNQMRYHVYHHGYGYRYFDNIVKARKYLMDKVLYTYPLMQSAEFVRTEKLDKFGEHVPAGKVVGTDYGFAWIAKGSTNQVPLNEDGTVKRKH